MLLVTYQGKSTTSWPENQKTNDTIISLVNNIVLVMDGQSRM